MAGDMDRDIPGSGTGWDQVQYGGMTLREVSGLNNPSTNPGSDYPSYPTTAERLGQPGINGNKSLIYPILTWGIAASVFFHFGLQHSALSTLPGFIESSVLVGVTCWVNTAKGRSICEMLAIVGFLGAVVLGFLLFAAYKMGYIKQPLTFNHQANLQHTKHNLHTSVIKHKG